jgi:hypothetical protein
MERIMQLFPREWPSLRQRASVSTRQAPPAAQSGEDLGDLMAAVSGGSRKAFAILYERSVDLVRQDLAAELPDSRQAAGVLAQTYVEVWWLAGCYTGTGTNVVPWIRQIAGRRAVEARMHGKRRSDAADPPSPTIAELELAALLGHPPAT